MVFVPGLRLLLHFVALSGRCGTVAVQSDRIAPFLPWWRVWLPVQYVGEVVCRANSTPSTSREVQRGLFRDDHFGPGGCKYLNDSRPGRFIRLPELPHFCPWRFRGNLDPR